jgi:hypothetical protein
MQSEERGGVAAGNKRPLMSAQPRLVQERKLLLLRQQGKITAEKNSLHADKMDD